jgi:hypothetical protein
MLKNHASHSRQTVVTTNLSLMTGHTFFSDSIMIGKILSGRIVLVMLTSLLVVYAFVRIAAPIYLGHHVREQVTTLSSYKLKFSSIDVSIFQGSYTLTNLALLDPKGSGEPFFMAKTATFSLCKGEGYSLIAGHIEVREPSINIYVPATKRSTKTPDYPWINVARRLMGVPVEYVSITDGAIHYEDHQSFPVVNLSMEDIDLTIEGLNSPASEDDVMVGRAMGTARIDEGSVAFSLNFDPAAEMPTFDLKARLDNLNLEYLADYLTAHGSSTSEKGLFSMLAQATGEETSISGVVKPLLETINLAAYQKRNPAAQRSFTRHPFARQLAPISFHGDLDLHSLSLWEAVAFTLRNAFLEGLAPVIQKTNSGDGERNPLPRVIIPSPEKEFSL